MAKKNLLKGEKKRLESESKDFNFIWPSLLYLSRNQWKREIISKEALIHIYKDRYVYMHVSTHTYISISHI